MSCEPEADCLPLITHYLALKREARYANRHSGQAQTLVDVGSTPTRATPDESPSDVRWAARLSVKQPPYVGNVGSIPTRGTRSDIRCQVESAVPDL